VVLVNSFVHCGDLFLTKGVVEGVVYGAGRLGQAAGGGAVDHQTGLQRVVC